MSNDSDASLWAKAYEELRQEDIKAGRVTMEEVIRRHVQFLVDCGVLSPARGFKVKWED